jgi:hypothetical protein
MTTTTTRPPATVFTRLCSIERRLHKWAEAECNGEIQWDDDEGTIPRRYLKDRWGGYTLKGGIIPNSEKRWLAEATRLANECGGHVYHQSDPRGCALYFYRDSDLVGHSYPINCIYSTVALACCA